jgi:hypothetical protein
MLLFFGASALEVSDEILTILFLLESSKNHFCALKWCQETNDR